MKKREANAVDHQRVPMGDWKYPAIRRYGSKNANNTVDFINFSQHAESINIHITVAARVNPSNYRTPPACTAVPSSHSPRYHYTHSFGCRYSEVQCSADDKIAAPTASLLQPLTLTNIQRATHASAAQRTLSSTPPRCARPCFACLTSTARRPPPPSLRRQPQSPQQQPHTLPLPLLLHALHAPLCRRRHN